ncbi:MAG: hypothetical protein K5697_16925 [Lachnospiraceae bacterium]|nr:hypothetical protein [Lachnospiraceae bacterium]
MRKNVIYTEASTQRYRLYFRYRGKEGDQFLFSRHYDKKVHSYFCNGKSLDQLRRDNMWKRYKPLAKLVEERIPRAVRSLEKGGSYGERIDRCVY